MGKRPLPRKSVKDMPPWMMTIIGISALISAAFPIGTLYR